MAFVDGMASDRSNFTLWGNTDALIDAVAAVNNDTVVVVHSVRPAIVEPSIENPNVTAVLLAGHPGQESGNAPLINLLYRDVNPSAGLPYSIAKDPFRWPQPPVSVYMDDTLYDSSTSPNSSTPPSKYLTDAPRGPRVQLRALEPSEDLHLCIGVQARLAVENAHTRSRSPSPRRGAPGTLPGTCTA